MKSMNPLFRSLWLACVASVLMISLIADGTTAPAVQSGQGTRKLRLSLFRTGSLSMGSPDSAKILLDALPLVRHIEKETGAKVEMTVPTDYGAVIEAMVNKQVDIAFFGGLEYVQASARAGAKALVQRREDQDWRTVFIAQPQLQIHSLKDLNGHSFAFGDVTSVAGHVMPEYYMREAKIDTKVIENALFTGRHDYTALAVANKKADAGAMAEWMFQQMMREGKITEQQVRVFWSPPPFVDSVWAARPDLDPKLAESFANAFLKLDAKNPEYKVILDFFRATKYFRAKDSDYDLLRQGAKLARLIE